MLDDAVRDVWRNLVSAAVSAFGVLQIFILLALVQLGLSSADGNINLGHSKTAQTDSNDPSNSLTGASDEAAHFELVLGILLIVVVLCIAAVHRKKVAAALIACRDRTMPYWLRLRSAVQRCTYALSGMARVEQVESRQARRDSSLPLPADEEQAAASGSVDGHSRSERRSQQEDAGIAMAALGSVVAEDNEEGEAAAASRQRQDTRLELESIGDVSGPRNELPADTRTNGEGHEGYATLAIADKPQHSGSLYKPPVFVPPADTPNAPRGQSGQKQKKASIDEEEQPGSAPSAPFTALSPTRPPRPQLQPKKDGTYVLYTPTNELTGAQSTQQSEMLTPGGRNRKRLEKCREHERVCEGSLVEVGCFERMRTCFRIIVAGLRV